MNGKETAWWYEKERKEDKEGNAPQDSVVYDNVSNLDSRSGKRRDSFPFTITSAVGLTLSRVIVTTEGMVNTIYSTPSYGNP